MDNDTRKQIIKFAKPQSWYTVLGIIFIVSGIILFIPIMIMPVTRRIFEVSMELNITALVIGAVFLIRQHIIKSRVTARLDLIEQSFGHFVLENDFFNGEKRFNGSVIMGDCFVIGKATGTIAAYEDIKKVCCKIYRHNFREFFRQIKVVLEDGKTLTVCTIFLSTNIDFETDRIFEIIKLRNPGITSERK